MTIATVNKELKRLKIDGKIVRGKGYYYFIGCLFDLVPAIYANNLDGYTLDEIINHIKKHL